MTSNGQSHANASEITYVIHMASTIGQLWAALTERKALQENWGDIQSSWTKGAPVAERDESGKILWKGEVLRSEAPNVLSYTMEVPGIDEPPTEVTVELGPPLSPIAPNATVVRLVLTQAGFPERSKLRPGCARAWPEILSSIKSYVETGRPLGFAWKH
jgi:uncharacterized protein YndB with AHSA1/START domain